MRLKRFTEIAELKKKNDLVKKKTSALKCPEMYAEIAGKKDDSLESYPLLAKLLVMTSFLMVVGSWAAVVAMLCATIFLVIVGPRMEVTMKEKRGKKKNMIAM